MTLMDRVCSIALVSLMSLSACSGQIGGGSAGDGEVTFPNGGSIAAKTMPRLNTTEYRNTVRDLLATRLDPAASFPADDVSLGFDNISQVLTVSPLHFELYEQAAEALADEALDTSNSVRDAIVFCNARDRACRDDVLQQFASRAWRRPATNDEVTRLQLLVDVALDDGDTVDEGLALAIKAILLSPHFIFRPELDDDPSSMRPHRLTDYELASRLSYFLWSSMPDEALFEAADNGSLQDDATLAAEVDRMLADPKAIALVDNFAGQWLRIRSVADVQPDYMTFPDWDEALRDAMQDETRLFFGEFLNGVASIDQLLLADFTFLNQRLAQHYGLPFDGGDTLEKVALDGDSARFGLLTQGSILAVTSVPTRTSPVKRGVWVLEELLCDGPPAPPPGVEGLIDQGVSSGSLREQLEQHRTDPNCAACHATMDPIGLGFENYDAIGAFRTEDQGFAIDASGELPDGPQFTDARGLAEALQADTRLNACVVEKLLMYALGREVDANEMPFVEEIVAGFEAEDLRLPALIKLVVLSEPFRTRRGTEEAP